MAAPSSFSQINSPSSTTAHDDEATAAELLNASKSSSPELSAAASAAPAASPLTSTPRAIGSRSRPAAAAASKAPSTPATLLLPKLTAPAAPVGRLCVAAHWSAGTNASTRGRVGRGAMLRVLDRPDTPRLAVGKGFGLTTNATSDARPAAVGGGGADLAAEVISRTGGRACAHETIAGRAPARRATEPFIRATVPRVEAASRSVPAAGCPARPRRAGVPSNHT